MTAVGLPQRMGAIKHRPLLLKVPSRLLVKLTSWCIGICCARVWVNSAMAPTPKILLSLIGTQRCEVGFASQVLVAETKFRRRAQGPGPKPSAAAHEHAVAVVWSPSAGAWTTTNSCGLVARSNESSNGGTG